MRPPPPDTHQRILDEALGLIVTQGYANTSVAEIADRIGFTKAALYYHFRSKDEILLELLTPLLDDLDELVEGQAPDPSAPGRRAAMERYLDLLIRHGRIVGVLTNDVSALSHPAVAGRAMPAIQRFRSSLAGDQADESEAIGVAAALSVLSGALQVVPKPDDRQRDRILRAAEAALEAATTQA